MPNTEGSLSLESHTERNSLKSRLAPARKPQDKAPLAALAKLAVPAGTPRSQRDTDI